MNKSNIYIKGARVNNLKNIDVEIPRNKFIVITGLSGSGKSSLAFDTLYAEGQRRYVESLSSFMVITSTGVYHTFARSATSLMRKHHTVCRKATSFTPQV